MTYVTAASRRTAISLALMLACGRAWAVPANPRPMPQYQADGSTVSITLRGDEFGHWHEDGKGYTVLKDTATRNWVYAEKDAAGRLHPGVNKVGAVDPAALGISRRLLDDDRLKTAASRRASVEKENPAFRVSSAQSTLSGLAQTSAAARSGTAILTGTMKNLVILARFSDQSVTHTQAEFENLFNQTGYTADGAAGSVKDYYQEVSYGKLTVQSVVTAWVTLPHTQAYYGANVGGTEGNDAADQQMALDAVDALEASGFNFAQADGNGDGWVDGLDIIHSGMGEEYSGNSGDCIWSHQWNLPSVRTYDGVSMYNYHTEPEIRGWSSYPTSQGITRIGVICHETGHFLGLPDLYDTQYKSNGLGSFCLMSAGSWNGADNGETPAQLNAWCKKTLGWAVPTQLTTVGTKSISAVETSSSSMYMLRDSSFPSYEYFLIENKYGAGNFDAYLPGSSRGLLIWHVSEDVSDNSNNGTSTSAHYLVALQEASGTQHLRVTQDPDNFTSVDGDDSDYFRFGNNASFTDSTTPDSRSYGSYTLKLPISAVSASGPVMTFYLGTSDATPPATIAAVYDGLTSGSDITRTGSTSQLSANWTASSDADTGLAGYQYAIGTVSGTPGLAGWTDNGTSLYVTRTGLTLAEGTTYYFGVRAVNGVGVTSTPTWSNGQYVDTSMPESVPYVYDSTGTDIDHLNSLSRLSANWGASPSSGVTEYQYAAGTVPGGEQLQSWTSAALATSVTLTGLTLAEGTTYYVTVRAYNSVSGKYSADLSSDGQMVDVTSPTASVILSSPLTNGAFTGKLVLTEATGALAWGPRLTLTTSGGYSAPLTLTYLTGSTWTISGFVESYYSTGTASLSFRAADAAGNTGSSITSGASPAISQAITGSAGGTVRNSDGDYVTVPAGAYTGTLFVSISTAAASRSAAADSAAVTSSKIQSSDLVREFSARDLSGAEVTSFSSPLKVSLAYPDANGDGRIDGDYVSEGLAWLYYLDEAAGRWTPVSGTVRDASANTVSAQVSHFSVYSVRVADGSALSLSNLKAYPNPCDLSKVAALTMSGIPVDASDVKVHIFNSAGELVRTLSSGDGVDGVNTVTWDGRGKGGSRAASGLYIYLVKTGNYGKGKGKFFVIW